jgi:hypothetical protein
MLKQMYRKKVCGCNFLKLTLSTISLAVMVLPDIGSFVSTGWYGLFENFDWSHGSCACTGINIIIILVSMMKLLHIFNRLS